MSRKTIWDDLCVLKDAGAIGASAAAEVDSTAKIFDTGGGRLNATLVLNVTAIETDTATDEYIIELQGSSKADFADTIVTLAAFRFGHADALIGDVAPGIGIYNFPVTNEFNGTVYRYLRLYTVVPDTAVAVATGINYSAYLSKKR